MVLVMRINILILGVNAPVGIIIAFRYFQQSTLGQVEIFSVDTHYAMVCYVG